MSHEKPRFETIFPLDKALIDDLNWRFTSDYMAAVTKEREIIHAQADKTVAAFDTSAGIFGVQGAAFFRAGLTWANHILREAYNAKRHALSFVQEGESGGLATDLTALLSGDEDSRQAAMDDKLRHKDEALATSFIDYRNWLTQGQTDPMPAMLATFGASCVINRAVSLLEANGLEQDLG